MTQRLSRVAGEIVPRAGSRGVLVTFVRVCHGKSVDMFHATRGGTRRKVDATMPRAMRRTSSRGVSFFGAGMVYPLDVLGERMFCRRPRTG